jgi:hypothetical protein
MTAATQEAPGLPPPNFGRTREDLPTLPGRAERFGFAVASTGRGPGETIAHPVAVDAIATPALAVERGQTLCGQSAARLRAFYLPLVEAFAHRVCPACVDAAAVIAAHTPEALS